jgi:hypothetical protein
MMRSQQRGMVLFLFFSDRERKRKANPFVTNATVAVIAKIRYTSTLGFCVDTRSLHKSF